MPLQTVNARIRGFLCLNAHPTGCAANVRSQIDTIRRLLAAPPSASAGAAAPAGAPLRNALVIGSSTGYGLSSLLTAVFGYGARATSVCLERPPHGDKTASAGWYNLAEVHRLARDAGHSVTTFNGDAYSREIKDQVLASLKASGTKLDSVVYSLASPRRTDQATGVIWTSVLKPLGAPFRSQTINLNNDQITSVELQPATDADVEATRKVMGGEDWELWIEALAGAGLLAPGARSVAYSYIGPEVTWAIYKNGTIGIAKNDLERAAKAIDSRLRRIGGGAFISVNKALVTQASSAIPVVPLYISILYKIMKARGLHEGCAEQIQRLFAGHICAPGGAAFDEAGRARLDDLEMRPEVQAAVREIWPRVTTENLAELTDIAGYRSEFLKLFGFGLAGIDYNAEIEPHLPMI